MGGYLNFEGVLYEKYKKTFRNDNLHCRGYAHL
jgi:hypothetical protein